MAIMIMRLLRILGLIVVGLMLMAQGYSQSSPPGSEYGPGIMNARLLSAINTRTASKGDTFKAKLENGAYKGGILSGSIKEIKRDKGNLEIDISFNKMNGKPIPVGLDLVSIANAQGVKGVDDGNNKISGSSKKKKISVNNVGASGGVIAGKQKGAATGAGAGAGFVLNMKLTTTSQDIDLQPGGKIMLNAETGGSEGGGRKRAPGKDQ